MNYNNTISTFEAISRKPYTYTKGLRTLCLSSPPREKQHSNNHLKSSNYLKNRSKNVGEYLLNKKFKPISLLKTFSAMTDYYEDMFSCCNNYYDPLLIDVCHKTTLSQISYNMVNK